MINDYFTSHSIDVEDQSLDEMPILGEFFTHLSTTVEEIKKEEQKKSEVLNKTYSTLSSKNAALNFKMDSVYPSFRYPFL